MVIRAISQAKKLMDRLKPGVQRPQPRPKPKPTSTARERYISRKGPTPEMIKLFGRLKNKPTSRGPHPKTKTALYMVNGKKVSKAEFLEAKGRHDRRPQGSKLKGARKKQPTGRLLKDSIKGAGRKK